MATKRPKKRRRIEVSGHVTIEEQLSRWEVELVLAALTRLHCARPTSSAAEGTDAAR
jgi:hypothetical protein